MVAIAVADVVKFAIMAVVVELVELRHLCELVGSMSMELNE
jgi:hypothetical protein